MNNYLYNRNRCYPVCLNKRTAPPLKIPPELTKAHNNLDRAVVAAYGGPGFKTEAKRVADLMKHYQKLTTGKS